MTLTAPIWVPWVLIKARRRKEQPNWKERQGDFDLAPRKDGKRIWLHAVSVGEVVAAKPILSELRKLLPDHEIVLSVTTSSGHQAARETLRPDPQLQTPNSKLQTLYDYLVYFPLDVPRFQLAAMQRVQPTVVAIMETELWFNFLWAAKTFRARTLLVNGRISDRSYPRARFLRFFYSRLLRMVDRCLMQTEKDAERIRALGAASADVLGNCKFDQAVEGLDADPAEWRSKLDIPSSAKVIVVGSTRGEEEERFVLDAIAGMIDGSSNTNDHGDDRQSSIDNPSKLHTPHSTLAIVHAPRHLERVPDLARELERRFGTALLRSQINASTPQHLNTPIPRYIILDTYGELSSVYSIADVVVIGGGFADLGGQNLLQPLAHGKPVLHGPHMQNFREVADAASGAGATRICETPDQLRDALAELLNGRELRARMGAAARALVQANLGASHRYAEAIAGASMVNV